LNEEAMAHWELLRRIKKKGGGYEDTWLFFEASKESLGNTG